MSDRARTLTAALIVALALVFVIGPFPLTQMALGAGFVAGVTVSWAYHSRTRSGGHDHGSR